MIWRRSLLGLALAGLAQAAISQASGPVAIPAARARGDIHLDGVLDEPAWAAAAPYTRFVESYPREGDAPTQRTEVRVLYDDRAIYVGVICFDTEPERILRQLGRRDSAPAADLVEVSFDSTRGGRTGYTFSVNAAGVLRDALLFGDVNVADSWDGVWDAAVAQRPDGWSLEMAIPLNLLRFPRAHEQTWGVLVRRTVPRTHQVFDSVPIPKSANGLVSRFQPLTGLVDLRPQRDLELSPYIAARLARRPQYSDPARPAPRLLAPSGDVGLDLRASLFSDLTLVAAINPDFGQVDADQVILNLSNQEQFFPEKRPLFNQGLDLFQPVGAEYGAPHQIFYSRRIGLQTPILAAAKVTGTAWRGLDLGLLDAVVTGPGNPRTRAIGFTSPVVEDLQPYQSNPDRSLRLHAARPFHLGLEDELPTERPTPTNYFAGVLRQQVGVNSSVGATFAAASPLRDRCTPADFAVPDFAQKTFAFADQSCLGAGGEAAGLDWNVRSPDAEWVFLGALNGSRRIGGPVDDVQRDGTVIHPGELGLGGYTKIGKYGGEGVRASFTHFFSSPTLDLNPVGFLPTQNQQSFQGHLWYYRSQGIGSLHDINAGVIASSYWTTDGRWTPRGNYVVTNASVTLPGYQVIGLELNFEVPRYDVREVNQLGIPFERRGDVAATIFGNSDPNRSLQLQGAAYLFRAFRGEPVPPQTGFGASATVIWRPLSRLESQLDVRYDRQPQGARFVDTAQTLPDGTKRLVFGRQDPEALTATFRQTLVLTPRLTFQAYAQFFASSGTYPQFYEAFARPGSRLHIDNLRETTSRFSDLPAAFGLTDPAFHNASLNLNLVLRWEYRLGSTLFVVYSRAQNELGLRDGQAPTRTLFPSRLGPGPTTDTFLVKWSYFWDA